MDNSTSEQDSNIDHTRGSFIELRIVNRLVKWLISLLHLPADEQEMLVYILVINVTID